MTGKVKSLWEDVGEPEFEPVRMRNMDFSEVYAGNRLAGKDLPPGKQFRLVINGASVVTLKDRQGNEEKKVELTFHNTEKTLILNKTNFNTIAGVHTPDGNNWIGKPIFVYQTQTQMGPGVGVYCDLEGAGRQMPQPQQQPPQQPRPADPFSGEPDPYTAQQRPPQPADPFAGEPDPPAAHQRQADPFAETAKPPSDAFGDDDIDDIPF